MDDKWQWGTLGDGGERFVVYQGHVAPGLFNVSIRETLWNGTDDIRRHL